MGKTSQILDVGNHVVQLSKNTSFAACAEMVLTYLGTPLNQRDIYEKAKSGEEGTATDSGIALALMDLGYKVVTWWNEKKDKPKELKEIEDKFYWPQYWRAVKNGVLVKKENADIRLIQELLDKGFPVIAEVDNGKFYNTQTTWTQRILVNGYSNTHFTYQDPLSSSGKDKKIEFKKFEESWLETPFVDRSMSIIVKKDENI